MIKNLRHLVIVARDFGAGLDDYARLLARAPIGCRQRDGVQSAWFALSNVAVEVVTPVAPGDRADSLRAHLERFGQGLVEAVFIVDDLGAAGKLFSRRALEMTEARVSCSPELSQNGLRVAIRHSYGIGVSFVTAPPLTAKAHMVDGLDHLVIGTKNPERATAFWGARLGMDLRLDRVMEPLGARLIFFRCGSAVIELAHVLNHGVDESDDRFGGLSWRVSALAPARERLLAAGQNVSEMRIGRRPGTQVCTLRSGALDVPTLLLSGAARPS